MVTGIKKILVCLLILLTGIAALSADAARDALEKFLTAMADMDYSREYTLLCSEDRAAMSEQEYIETIHALDLGVLRSKDLSRNLYEFLTKEKLAYQISTDSRDGNTRVFEVEQHDLEYSFPAEPQGWDGKSYELTIVDVFPVD